MAELAALDAVTEAVESGAGLPEVVRAAARALDASLAVTTRGARRWRWRRARRRRSGRCWRAADRVSILPLRVADAVVGSLHMRARAEPSASMRRLLVTMIASEVERVRARSRLGDGGGGLPARAPRARADRPRGAAGARRASSRWSSQTAASMIVARAHPQAPTEEGWRARVRAVAERGAPRVREPLDRGALRARGRGGRGGPAAGAGRRGGARGAGGRRRAARAGGGPVRATPFAVGRSRIAEDPPTCRAPPSEALLAANVAEGGDQEAPRAGVRGDRRLPAAALDDEREPARAAALLRRDRRAAGGLRRAVRDRSRDARSRRSSTPTATSRAPRSACSPTATRSTTASSACASSRGLDVGSSDGREKLSLGLKAMRVLGIAQHRSAPAVGGRAPARARVPPAASDGGPRCGRGCEPRLGGSSNGRTSGFGPENRGSSPCPPALPHRECVRY